MIAVLRFSSTGLQGGRHCLETDLSELQSRGEICDTLPNKNVLHFYDANRSFKKLLPTCACLIHTRIPGC